MTSTSTENARPRIIAGFGRSGTTWVQDVLAESNHLRAVFEPLHPRNIEGANQFANKYYAANDENPALRRMLDKYVRGDYWSMWADYRLVSRNFFPRKTTFSSWNEFRNWMAFYSISRNNYLRYRRQRRRSGRIIKLVRANMMLGWLKNAFDARIVFIVRHPAAVIASQLKAKKTWDPNRQLELYRCDDQLLDVLGGDARDLLCQDLDDVSALALSWCIENKIAIRQVEESDLTMVFYENLLRAGESEWRKVLSALNLRQIPDAGLISEPSQQAWGEKAMDSNLVRQYDLWMSRIDDRTATSIQAVLDAMDMGIYSMDQALPITSVTDLQA